MYITAARVFNEKSARINAYYDVFAQYRCCTPLKTAQINAYQDVLVQYSYRSRNLKSVQINAYYGVWVQYCCTPLKSAQMPKTSGCSIGAAPL